MTTSSNTEANGTVLNTDAIIEKFTSACDAKNWDEVAEILFQHGFLLWFWIPPQNLAPIVAEFPLELLEDSQIARFLHAALNQPTAPLKFEHSAVALGSNPTQNEVLDYALSAGNLRLVGQQNDSLKAMTALIELAGTKSGSLIDQSSSRSGMMYLQAGLTALLAGDMVRSEAWHSRVANSFVDSQFPFMVRDALGKLALTYLLCSEPDHARRSLDGLADYPPTASWVEFWISASLELSELALNDPDELTVRVADPNFDWQGAGEIWAVIVWLALRHLLASDRSVEALRIIDRVDVLGLPASGGDGVPGSVLGLWRANVLITNGDYAGAAEALKPTDSSLLEVQLAWARLEYLTGKTKQALGRLVGLPTSVYYFGQTRLEHALLAAACYLKLGDTEHAKRTMINAVRPDTTAYQLALALPPASVLSYAQRNWVSEAGLESVDWAACGLGITEHDPTVDLSSREIEVLRLLVTELSREDIAAKLHVTENTLKSHLRSIYRKLDVRTRQEAAVVAAQYLRRVEQGV